MRVSVFEQYGLSNHYSAKLQADLAKKSLQITTGKQFIYPSDNPIKMNQSLLLNSSQNRVEQLQKNVEDAKSFLERTESVLGSAVEIIQYTREQAILASSGQHNDVDRETFAKIIEDNIQQIVGLANTKHLNRYLFSGEKTQTIAFTYDGATATYNGDSNNITFKIGDYQEVAISETGDVVFQQLIDSMIQLRDSVKSGTDDDIRTAISEMDKGFEQLIDVRAELGVRTQGLELMSDTYKTSVVDIKAKISLVEDADITEVYSDYMKSSQLYQGTIQATLKMMQSSILNYL